MTSLSPQAEAVLPHVIRGGREREIGTVSGVVRVSIDRSDRTGRAVGATERVDADDEEPAGVEGFAVTAEERSPPVRHVCASREGMANHHGIVAFFGQLPPRAVCDWHILQRDTRLEGKGRNDGKLLVRDELREWVFGLQAAASCALSATVNVLCEQRRAHHMVLGPTSSPRQTALVDRLGGIAFACVGDEAELEALLESR